LRSIHTLLSEAADKQDRVRRSVAFTHADFAVAARQFIVCAHQQRRGHMSNAYEPGPGPSQPTPSPSGPTPEDPREHEPMRDPPIYPERDDDVGVKEVRQANGASGVEAPDPLPDDAVHDSAVE